MRCKVWGFDGTLKMLKMLYLENVPKKSTESLWNVSFHQKDKNKAIFVLLVQPKSTLYCKNRKKRGQG
jgi:hypothetical protein